MATQTPFTIQPALNADINGTIESIQRIADNPTVSFNDRNMAQEDVNRLTSAIGNTPFVTDQVFINQDFNQNIANYNENNLISDYDAGLQQFFQTSQDPRQYRNDFIGEETENIPDPNYVAQDINYGQGAEPGSALGGVPTIAPGNTSPSGGVGAGIWESLDYAKDWTNNHGKYSFLFKVSLGGPYQFYVKSITKPSVKMNHAATNYYNFRTQVLTSVTFDSMRVVLWDEQRNTVHEFFKTYLSTVSGQGSGNWGIDKGFDANKSSSSSKSYRNNGACETVLSKVIVEQVFQYGAKSNRFTFTNARIESMEFDDLAHESNNMSTLTLTFNYDAIQCETVSHSVIHTDPSAELDLLRGGGAAGSAFGANDDGRRFTPMSIFGTGGPLFSGFSGDPFGISNIFNNVVPQFGAGINIGPNGVNVGLSGGIPGVFGGNLQIGPNGVRGGISGGIPGMRGNLQFGPGGVSGGLSVGVPGFGGNLRVGPNGISGGISGGLPGVGGNLQFGPNGIVSGGIGIAGPGGRVGFQAGPGGVRGGIGIGGPNFSAGLQFQNQTRNGVSRTNVSGTLNAVFNSVQTIRPVPGSVIPEATYLKTLSYS